MFLLWSGEHKTMIFFHSLFDVCNSSLLPKVNRITIMLIWFYLYDHIACNEVKITKLFITEVDHFRMK